MAKAVRATGAYGLISPSELTHFNAQGDPKRQEHAQRNQPMKATARDRVLASACHEPCPWLISF
jgi:hypothetical protein